MTKFHEQKLYKKWGYYFMIAQKEIMKTAQKFPIKNLTKYIHILNLKYLYYSDLLIKNSTTLTNPIFN